MISVKEVAGYFLVKSEPGTKREITHLKLQKLVYYSQGYYLALNKGEPMFKEKLQAWVHGPVCPMLYYEFRLYDDRAIPPLTKESLIEDLYKKVLDSVWKVYGKFDGIELERLTHEETPWIKARKGAPAWKASNDEISIESMQEYFSRKLCGGN